MKALLILFFFGFISCSSDNLLKKEEFDKVELGMTTEKVKGVLGEPHEVKLTFDSDTNYFYYIEKNILTTEYAVITFNKKGQVSFLFFGNPDNYYDK